MGMIAKNRNPQLLDGSFNLLDGRRGAFFINLGSGVWTLELGSDRLDGKLGDSYFQSDMEVSSFPFTTPTILSDPKFPDTAEMAPMSDVELGLAARGSLLNQSALRLGVRGRPEQLVLLNMRLPKHIAGELWITAPGGLCWYEGGVQWALSYFH